MRTRPHYILLLGKDSSLSLLAAGTDANKKSTSGWRPIHGAAKKGSGDIVKLLAGVPVSHCDGEVYDTALSIARWDGQPEVVKLLVCLGASEDSYPLDGSDRPIYDTIKGEGL